MYKLASDIISKHCCQELFTHLPPCTTTMFYMLSTCLQRAAVHDVFWVKFGVVSPGSRPQPRHLVASVLFCLLFLACFFRNTLPSRQRATMNGTILQLHKSGGTNKTSDQRPVVLLNSVYQLLHYVINERLGKIVEPANILEPGQGGGR